MEYGCRMQFMRRAWAAGWRVFTAATVIAILIGTMRATAAAAQANAASAHNALRIYFVDVEGGQATLFVTPRGRSLLIDTGWNDHNGRDADRIAAAAKQAGVSRLDYVLITHYHGDHVGGVPQLAAKMPIGTFFDHGPDREVVPEPGWQYTKAGYDAYQKVLATGKYKHVVLHAGEKLPVKGLDGIVVSADGAVIDHPVPGGGDSNAACGDADRTPAGLEDPDMTENGRALAVFMRFGRVRILDPGDLTWDRERMLMCPVNKLGHINIFIVGNHGMAPSTSPALVDGIAPQVAIMDNGARKGGTVRVLDLIRNAPSNPVLWQLHYAEQAGAQHNTDPSQIANLTAPTGRGPSEVEDKGYMLEVTVQRDGRFTILNERTGETRIYTANP